jgi:uncharacterized protein (DUF433 family)
VVRRAPAGRDLFLVRRTRSGLASLRRRGRPGLADKCSTRVASCAVRVGRTLDGDDAAEAPGRRYSHTLASKTARIWLSSRHRDSHLRSWYNQIVNVIVKNRDILGGTPVFRGTRVPIQTLFDYLEGGETLEDFLEGFPTVTRESAVAALEEAKDLLLARS